MAVARQIMVNSQARLESISTFEGQVKYSEFYANWRTGNYFTVSANSTEEEIVAIYKEKFPLLKV